MNVAGEPSTGNLYTRFDEGRGGQAYGLAPSSTLPSGFIKFHFEIRSPLVLKALVGFQLGNQTSPQVTFDFLTDWDVSCLN